MFTIVCPHCLANAKWWTPYEAFLWLEKHNKICTVNKEYLDKERCPLGHSETERLSP